MKKLLFVFTLFVAFVMQANAQSVLGVWATYDDKTGEKKSHVKVYESGGKVYGKIIKLFRDADEDQDPVCEKCTGSREGQKVIGLKIITGMSKDGDEYNGGKILDPENGKEYTCKMWLEDEDSDVLKVRGYWGFIYRTQTWERAE